MGAPAITRSCAFDASRRLATRAPWIATRALWIAALVVSSITGSGLAAAEAPGVIVAEAEERVFPLIIEAPRNRARQ